MKVLINKCYGGFGLSNFFYGKLYEAITGNPVYFYRQTIDEYYRLRSDKGLDDENLVILVKDYGEVVDIDTPVNKLDIDNFDYLPEDFEIRTDERAINIVEKYENCCNGHCANISIEEYDDENFEYEIDEYDGFESLILKPIINLDKILSISNKEDLRKYFEELNIKVK